MPGRDGEERGTRYKLTVESQGQEMPYRIDIEWFDDGRLQRPRPRHVMSHRMKSAASAVNGMLRRLYEPPDSAEAHGKDADE